MKEQLLSILNENSAELTVGRAMQIAELLFNKNNPDRYDWNGEINFNTIALLQSFESVKKIRLEKGQFVCEVEKTDILGHFNYDFKKQTETYTENEHFKAYELALQKVIFAGFEKGEHHKDVAFHNSDMLSIQFALLGVVYFTIMDKQTYLTNPTIGDLLTEIERYNRTAKEPIQLKFTENILPLLGVKI